MDRAINEHLGLDLHTLPAGKSADAIVMVRTRAAGWLGLSTSATADADSTSGKI